MDGVAVSPRVQFRRHAQRAAEGLEHRLGHVVGVVAAQAVDVQRRHGVVGEALEEFAHQVHVEVVDARPRVGDPVLQPRAPGEVEHHPRQRFVERHVGVAVAADAALVAKRLRAGLTEHDAEILDRVVRVHLQVALGADAQVQQAVAGDLLEHVLEERQAGGELGAAGAVQRQFDLDARLARLALDAGSAGGHGRGGSSGERGHSTPPAAAAESPARRSPGRR